MSADADDAHLIARRLWRAARWRRAGLWAAGAVPWLYLRNAPGLLAWSAFCAWDGLRLQRRVGHGWAAWIDADVPEMEDSSVLLLDDSTSPSPIAALQRRRLLARLAGSLDGPRVRAIVRRHVRVGWPWLAADLALAALAWLTVTQPHAAQAGVHPAASLAAAAELAGRPGLVLTLTPPAYTGVAASTSAPRDLQAPEGTRIRWCLRTPSDSADERVELGDGQLLRIGRECAAWTAAESLLWRWRGTRYTLKIVPDRPPEIVVSEPAEMTHDLARDARGARIAVAVRDDYRVQQATLHLTLARGSGENVRFTDRELPLPASSDPRRRDWRRDWSLADLGMEPGDELYFFVRASDNAGKPHTVQSSTYTLRLPAPPSKEDDDATSAMPMLAKPESLRSQRQVIIDTEQLMADMRNRKLSPADQRERSERIADDEGVLRRRYGQFLGEESTLFGKDDDDDDHGKGHDGKPDVLHEFGHAHDQPENATLFDDGTKRVLRRVLSAMWDAEKALRNVAPQAALNPENKALVAIKELQQAERIYLHKTSSEIPPIKEDKRMAGDMAGAASYKRDQATAQDPVPADLRGLVAALATDGPLPALWTRTAHDWVRARIADDDHRLAAQRAIQDVADGCLACRPALRAWLRGGVAEAPVLLQVQPVAETPFGRALRGDNR